MNFADKYIARIPLYAWPEFFCDLVASIPDRMSSNQLLALFMLVALVGLYFVQKSTLKICHEAMEIYVHKRFDDFDVRLNRIEAKLVRPGYVPNKPPAYDPTIAWILEAVRSLVEKVDRLSDAAAGFWTSKTPTKPDIVLQVGRFSTKETTPIVPADNLSTLSAITAHDVAPVEPAKPKNIWSYSAMKAQVIDPVSPKVMKLVIGQLVTQVTEPVYHQVPKLAMGSITLQANIPLPAPVAPLSLSGVSSIQKESLILPRDMEANDELAKHYGMMAQQSGNEEDDDLDEFAEFEQNPEMYGQDGPEAPAEAIAADEAAVKVTSPITTDLNVGAASFVMPRHTSGVDLGVDIDSQKHLEQMVVTAPVISLAADQTPTAVLPKADEPLSLHDAILAVHLNDHYVEQDCRICEMRVDIDIVDGKEDWNSHNRVQHRLLVCGATVNKWDIKMHQRTCNKCNNKDYGKDQVKSQQPNFGKNTGGVVSYKHTNIVDAMPETPFDADKKTTKVGVEYSKYGNTTSSTPETPVKVDKIATKGGVGASKYSNGGGSTPLITNKTTINSTTTDTVTSALTGDSTNTPTHGSSPGKLPVRRDTNTIVTSTVRRDEASASTGRSYQNDKAHHITHPSANRGRRPPMPLFGSNGRRPAPSADVPQWIGNVINYQATKHQD